jgi:hypothetical protein
MDYFERQPLLLILFIIATVEGWTLLKAFLKSQLASIREKRRRRAS